MAITRIVTTIVDRFRRPMSLNATAASSTATGPFGWHIADTSAAGSPVYAVLSGGFMEIKMTSDSEVQNLCMYQNDILPFPVARIHNVWFVARVPTFSANSVLVMGAGTARNDDEDLVADSAWFKMEGATSTSNVVLECDDGTNEQNDIASGDTLAGTFKKFNINFTEGGLGDLRFSIDGSRVAATTTFSIAASTANLQLMVQLSKASSADVSEVELGEVGIQYETNFG